MKKTIIALLAVLPLFTACITDDGSYDYNEIAEITIEGIPEMTEVLAYLDHVKISPRFYSSIDGEIKPGDPNYTVQYRFGHKGMGSMGVDSVAMRSIVWEDWTPDSGFDIDHHVEYSTGAYLLWVTITDNRNNSVTSKQYEITIGSTTYEGWLVLCNEGNDERVRLDMISKISSTRTEAIHDIAAGLPLLHHATCIHPFTQGSTPGDQIYLFSREGSYELNPESLESEAEMEYNNLRFSFDPDETIIKEDLLAGSTYAWLQKYKVCFGEKGNAYLFADGTYGACFSLPINTTVEGGAPEFRVAPYMGFNWTRPWDASYACNILFYDIDNRRFMVFLGGTNFADDGRLQLNVIADPTASETQLFSYSTGKDFVYMQSTRRSNGLVYSILQDPTSGKRSIYGINLGGSTIVQELYIENVDAPDFDKATQFAFDNRFPLLFYSVGSKLYLYNLGTKQAKELQTGLGSDEITKLKFNLYRAPDYSNLANQSEEFMNQQYRLIVCSYNSSDVNGGKVTFFDVDGVNNDVVKGEQFTGFAKITDIAYREREND
ncbi:MAG: hypothetical protein IKX44_03575 [Prevotella sp.]|nr:hypothetical protein [Prevotella sp.]